MIVLENINKNNIKIENKIRKNKIFKSEDILITNNKKEIYYYLLNDFNNIYKLLEYKKIEEVIDLLFEKINVNEYKQKKEYFFINYFIKNATESYHNIEDYNYEVYDDYNVDNYYEIEASKNKKCLTILLKLNIINKNNFHIVNNFKNYILNDKLLFELVLEKNFDMNYTFDDILKIEYLNNHITMKYILEEVVGDKKLSKNEFDKLKKYIGRIYYNNILVPYIDPNVISVEEKESLLKNNKINTISLFNLLFKKNDKKYDEYLLLLLSNLSDYNDVAKEYRNELISILKNNDIIDLYSNMKNLYNLKDYENAFNNKSKYAILDNYVNEKKSKNHIYIDFIKDLDLQHVDINEQMLKNIYNMCNEFNILNFINYVIENKELYYNKNYMANVIKKNSHFFDKNLSEFNKRIVKKAYNNILDNCMSKNIIIEELMSINIYTMKKKMYEKFILNSYNNNNKIEYKKSKKL